MKGKAKQKLHTQIPELRAALTLPADQRTRKRNIWLRHGRHSNLQTDPQEVKYWLDQVRASSTSK